MNNSNANYLFFNTSNNSLDTLGGKISSVIYPKTSEENLINTIGICFESNDGVSCDCMTTEEHTKSEDRKNPCRKNRPSSLMFDGVKIEKMVEINHNWNWCKNSKPTSDGNRTRCGMAIRREHQKPALKKLSHRQMFGQKRAYQAGNVPNRPVDISKHITWTAHIVRGKYDEEVKARASSSTSSNRRIIINQTNKSKVVKSSKEVII